MSDSRDNKPEPKPAADLSEEKRSGRVAFDSRGNSVWEWQVQTGVYSRDVNTENVRKLDLDELSIEDSAIRKLADEDDTEQESEVAAKKPAAVPLKMDTKAAGSGFNPYDNSKVFNQRSGGRNPYDNARLRADALHGKAAASQPPPRPIQPTAMRKAPTVAKPASTDVKKLSAWLKLKQALLGKKD